MEKYYFKSGVGSTCLEYCNVLDNGTFIGSIACQKCEFCKGTNAVNGNGATWIKCSLIDDAVTKNKEEEE